MTTPTQKPEAKTPPATATASEATKEAKEPRKPSLNAQIKSNWRQIVDLLVKGSTVPTELLKAAEAIIADLPIGRTRGLPLSEQLAEVEAAISELFATGNVVKDGKIVQNDDLEDKIRLLLTRKARIKAAIAKEK